MSCLGHIKPSRRELAKRPRLTVRTDGQDLTSATHVMPSVVESEVVTPSPLSSQATYDLHDSDRDSSREVGANGGRFHRLSELNMAFHISYAEKEMYSYHEFVSDNSTRITSNTYF